LIDVVTAAAQGRAQWPMDVAQQLAEIARDCIKVESTDRPTAVQLAERLQPLRTRIVDAEDIAVPRDCIICLENRRNIRIQPCGHQLLCEQCFEALRSRALPRQRFECPSCRALIASHDLLHDPVLQTFER
jgi:hypothetical protein